MAGRVREMGSIAPEDIAGIRDIHAHRYFGVDWDVVTDVLSKEIPILKYPDYIDTCRTG